MCLALRGFWTMAPLRYVAKFDPFLSLDCAPMPSTLAQSKERKGSNFAIWQPRFQVGEKYDGKLREWKNWTENFGIDAHGELILGSLLMELTESNIFAQNGTHYGDMMILQLRSIERQVKYGSVTGNLNLTGNEMETLERLMRNITDVKDGLENLEEEVKKEAWEYLRSVLETKIMNRTAGLIGEYVDRVIDQVENQVGKCGPLSISYDATVVAVCNQG